MKLLPSCREVRERLTDHEEGALSWRERLSLRWHLFLCDACSEFLKGLRDLPRAVRAILDPERPEPPEAGRALEEALRRIGPQRNKS
jgi:anti-sigma factor RsiW